MNKSLQQIQDKKKEIIESIKLFSSIKDELTSDETAPLITQISDFLQTANSDPSILQINSDIQMKSTTLKDLNEETTKFDKKFEEICYLQNYYFSEIQKDFQFAMRQQLPKSTE